LLDVGINRHSPQQRGPGRHFDEAIDSKADERNAARYPTCDHSYQTLCCVPCDGEILELSAVPDDPWPF
jgi:hypothetical protein